MRRDEKRYLVLAFLAAAAFLLTAAGGLYAQDYRPIPNPVIALNGTEEYTPSGGPAIMYKLKVTNWASYPDGMFVARPDLAACGANTSASRTWIDIYNGADNSYIYGFCGLGSASSLTGIWFGILLPGGMTPPASVYIKLVDRDPAFGGTYQSNTISVYSPTAPVANPDTLTTNEDTQGVATVLANDTDINGDSLSVTGIAVAPSHGSAFVTGNTVHYTPAANYNGTDSLSYSLFDGTYTSTGVVSVTVNAVKDPPVAVGDNASVNEDSSVTVNVLANDYDYDTPYGDVLTLQSVGSPSHGTASAVGGAILYTPSPNYNGSDSFTYTIHDSAALTSTATVNVTVNSVADAPNAPSSILTDGLTSPNNVSHYIPVFSWTFSDVDQADVSGDWQTAYQIRVGTAPGLSDVWDSGKLPSLLAAGPYAGVEPAANATYYWSVRVWDKYDLASTYSADGTFVILDIGLRVFDGTSTIRVATDYVGPSYPLRIYKNGTTYGIILVDPLDPSASKIRIQTATGIKALKKM